MDAKFQAILDSLPPKAPRSKLEPFAELIAELRKRERSYRQIADLLKERCGLSVGVHTLYSFVRTRGLNPCEVARQENKGNQILGDVHLDLRDRDTTGDIDGRTAQTTPSTNAALSRRGNRLRPSTIGDRL